MAIRDTSTTQLSHRRIVLAGTVSLAALLTAAAAQAQTATREVQVAQAQANQPTFRVVQILSAHSLRLVQRLLYYADLSHRQLPI